VRAAVSSLGYIANDAARSLRSDCTMTIGIAFFSLKLPGALEMLESLSRALDTRGYTLLIADTAGDEQRFDVILERFLQRRVDALICVNPDAVGPVLDRYPESGVPAIALMSRGRGASQLPLLVPTLEPALSEVIARLRTLGHHRICAMLPGGRSGQFGAVRRQLDASELDVEFLNPFAPEFEGQSVPLRLLERATTAVLTTYPVALQFLRACREAGVAVPADLSVVAVSDEPALSEMMETPLSAISVDLGAFGTEVAETLESWLGGAAPPRNTLVEVSTWVERATTGPARTKAQFGAN
jgi:LacI family transcriptional regulator